jgi:hypothetical protein
VCGNRAAYCCGRCCGLALLALGQGCSALGAMLRLPHARRIRISSLSGKTLIPTSTNLATKTFIGGQFVSTLSKSTSRSAEVRVPSQFAGKTFALKLLKGETAGVVSEIVYSIDCSDLVP